MIHIKEAARSLKDALSKYPWFINVGTGNGLFVYITRGKYRKRVEALLTELKWEGHYVTIKLSDHPISGTS